MQKENQTIIPPSLTEQAWSIKSQIIFVGKLCARLLAYSTRVASPAFACSQSQPVNYDNGTGDASVNSINSQSKISYCTWDAVSRTC